MVTLGRVVVDELVNSPLLTSMGFTSLSHIIRSLCRKNLQRFRSEMQKQGKALKGLALCLPGPVGIMVLRVWRGGGGESSGIRLRVVRIGGADLGIRIRGRWQRVEEPDQGVRRGRGRPPSIWVRFGGRIWFSCFGVRRGIGFV